MAETIKNEAPADDICKDPEVHQQKEKILKRQKWGNFLNAIQSITGMFGNPLWQAGLIGAATAIGASGLAFFGTTAGTSLLIMGGVGAALSLVGMVVNYIAAKHYQNINFDTMVIGTEHSAKLNAKNLVNELKENNLCLTDDTHKPCRSDGKKWTQVTQATAQTVQVNR